MLIHGMLIRFLFCIAFIGTLLYLYVDRQNEVREVQMILPKLIRERTLIQESNLAIRYEIEQCERPARLIALLKKPLYSHLKFPLTTEVIVIHEN